MRVVTPGGIGPAGHDAYEIWLKEGHTGSVADFLASLKSTVPGPPGMDAPTGLRTYPVAIAFTGQTVIPIPVPPTSLGSVCLTVNGGSYRAPWVAASEVEAVWSGRFPLSPNDDVVLTYA